MLAPAMAQAQIWGTPKFEMHQSDDRFSTDGMTTWSSEWNRISKRAIGGGRHIDDKGVFLDPFVLLDRGTGKLRSLGFAFRNRFRRGTIVMTPLSFGTPDRVTFLTGEGDPIVLPIKNQKRDIQERPTCDSVTLTCSSDETELGTIDLTIDQYRRIMTATALAAKVEGTEKSWIYETKDIDPKFFEHLRRFYEAHLAGVR